MKNGTWLLKLIGFWPPYLGTGIRVTKYQDDWSYIKVEMSLHFWNKNYVGTHFGGSLYTMVDPFYMLMLINRMGTDYIVWDKAASIRYRKAVKHPVYAEFTVDDQQVVDLKQSLKTKDMIEPVFKISIMDEQQQLIAEVEKTLHIQKKQRTV